MLNINSSNNNNYKNVSKKELFDKLSKLSLKQLKDINLDVNEIDYLKNKILNDKLGLVLNFEEKDEYLDNHYFGLEEVKELHINPKDRNNHLLIEGDNYYALKALQVSGIKVDVIYIDPPYNTGNKDFVYNDNFVEKDDQFKHSKWLSFMKKRLELARELLADDGVIFVSIDDNEQAYLKVLMDEIFGEENFVSNLAIELTKAQGMKVSAAQNGSVVKGYENILMYTKRKHSNIVKNILYDNADTFYDTHYEYWIENNKLMKLNDILKKDNYVINVFSKLNEEIKIQNIEKVCFLSEGFKKWIINNANHIYRKSNIFLERIKELKIDDNEIYEFEKYKLIKNKLGTIEQLQPLSNSLNYSNAFKPEITRTSIRSNLWKEFYKDMMNVEKEANVTFNNGKKPTRLIKQLIYWVLENKKGIILDFFAGSGTTAQAVMELNEEDGGNRRFILCTNNENNIAQDICRERIYRVINGKGSNDEKISWKYSKDKKSLNNNSMKYLKVKPIHNVSGEYEEIIEMKKIYKDEFNKDLSVKDFK